MLNGNEGHIPLDDGLATRCLLSSTLALGRKESGPFYEQCEETNTSQKATNPILARVSSM